MPRKKVLIAGASGLVGFAAIRLFSQRDDWDVVAVSRRVPAGIERYRSTFIPIDLLDQQRCAEVFGAMSDVTHLVYAAVNEKAGDLVRGWRDREQMQTNLTMMRNLFEPLSAAARTFSTSHFCKAPRPTECICEVRACRCRIASATRAISMRTSTGCRRITSAASRRASAGTGRYGARNS